MTSPPQFIAGLDVGKQQGKNGEKRTSLRVCRSKKSASNSSVLQKGADDSFGPAGE